MREGETPLKHAAPVGLSLDWSVGFSFSPRCQETIFCARLNSSRVCIKGCNPNFRSDRGEFVFLTAKSTLSFDKANLVVLC